MDSITKSCGLLFASLTLAACNISIDVTGVGKVTSEGGELDCGYYGSACSHDYSISDNVTLTAEPAPGYQFVGWSLANCGNSPTCDTKANTDRRISATFELVDYSDKAVVDLPFNDEDLADCVNQAAQANGWSVVSQVTNIHCEAGTDNIGGIEQLVNLQQAEFESKVLAMLGGVHSFDHPTLGDLSYFNETALDVLTVTHTYIAVEIGTNTVSPGIDLSPVTHLSELNLLGMIDSEIPSLNGFDSLERFTYERGTCLPFNYVIPSNNCGYLSQPLALQAFFDTSYAPQLAELNVYASKLGCDEVSSLFQNRPGMVLNGAATAEAFDSLYTCEEGFYDTTR